MMVRSRIGGDTQGARRSRPNPDYKGRTDALGNGPELNGLEPPVFALHMPIQRLFMRQDESQGLGQLKG